MIGGDLCDIYMVLIFVSCYLLFICISTSLRK